MASRCAGVLLNATEYIDVLPIPFKYELLNGLFGYLASPPL